MRSISRSLLTWSQEGSIHNCEKGYPTEMLNATMECSAEMLWLSRKLLILHRTISRVKCGSEIGESVLSRDQEILSGLKARGEKKNLKCA